MASRYKTLRKTFKSRTEANAFVQSLLNKFIAEFGKEALSMLHIKVIESRALVNGKSCLVEVSICLSAKKKDVN